MIKSIRNKIKLKLGTENIFFLMKKFHNFQCEEKFIKNYKLTNFSNTYLLQVQVKLKDHFFQS